MNVETLSKALDDAGLELVIGLETHIRLNTQTKLFCTCPNQEVDSPNTHICAVCTGQMGVLPAINKEAIRKAILFGKAVKSTFSNSTICWDRKHYEYPDQPKNFQLTQFQYPIIPDGEVQCFREDGSTFSVAIEQVHIEEDAAKLMHERKHTLVDFNKSGVPLIEVVTKPDLRSIRDAATFAQYLQRIVQNLQISNANLEKGEFKSDVSVSLRKKGTQDLNPRTEIKNLNSFKFMQEALVEEVGKQLEYFVQHQAPRPDQTTVLFDADLKQTKTMRKKEFAADYRYAQEPDIPFVNIQPEVEKLAVDTELLPFAIESTLIEGGIRPQDAKFFTADALRSKVYLSLQKELQDVKFVAKTLSNSLKPEDFGKIGIADLVALFSQLKAEKVTPVLFQNALNQLLEDPQFDYQAYFSANSISVEKIEAAIAEVITENQATAAEIAQGNQGKAGILVGKVIGKIGKGASGKTVRELILKQVGGSATSAITTSETTSNTSQEPKKLTKQEQDREDAELRKIPIVLREHYKDHNVAELSEVNLNNSLRVAGWVASVRDHGDLVFIDLRDASYQVLQIRLDRKQFPNLDALSKLKPESVISVEGIVVSRDEDDFNLNIKTGTIELDAKELDILNLSRTLPFEIKRASKSSESVRFKHKFLDHRSQENRQAIVNRHRVIKLIRDLLDEEQFIEVETPILTAGTDEGAREFIVPSRGFPGSFYTLPQAPQQFKQMLMVGGFEKYFQVARCFRDEDSRGDRQPEFTQLDIEMAFSNMQEIVDLNTRLLTEIVNKLYGNKWRLFPFKVLTYKESMEKYGCDRPDLRFGLEMQDITEIVRETSFQVFSKPIDEGGIVKCIKVNAEYQKQGRMTKGQIEKLTALAQENGLGGLAYIIVNEDSLQSPIIKFLGEKVAANIINKTNARVGDIVFFSAADYKTANKALDAVRQELGQLLNLIKPKELHPAWIIDFPFFEKTEEGNWTFTHNPFSMPKAEDLDKHMQGKQVGEIIAQQYDMVLNGFEIGGGSVRAHKPEILEATYKNMGYNHEEMLKSVGHLYQAFHYGAPPHGGIAWGIDRLLMILEKKNSIREVMAFPKTGSGEDLQFGSPSPLSKKKVREANIQVLNG